MVQNKVATFALLHISPFLNPKEGQGHGCVRHRCELLPHDGCKAAFKKKGQCYVSQCISHQEWCMASLHKLAYNCALVCSCINIPKFTRKSQKCPAEDDHPYILAKAPFLVHTALLVLET